MTSKKNNTSKYVSSTPNSITFSFSRLLALITGAVITSAVGTALTLSRIGISDHFFLLAVSADVDSLKSNSISRAEFTETIKRVDQKLDLLIDLQKNR